jgi:hypothetical protein
MRSFRVRQPVREHILVAGRLELGDEIVCELFGGGRFFPHVLLCHTRAHTYTRMSADTGACFFARRSRRHARGAPRATCTRVRPPANALTHMLPIPWPSIATKIMGNCVSPLDSISSRFLPSYASHFLNRILSAPSWRGAQAPVSTCPRFLGSPHPHASPYHAAQLDGLLHCHFGVEHRFQRLLVGVVAALVH